ncbi:MAG: hypothetical protein QW677_06035 [Pyrobaculum sp.]|uniref:Transcription elongation factor n=2 Tax=Pyrobaculum arsenaticum TaxID=121277 RepID=A4WLS8_PYRAR|nr:hypothetical protein [Pyrobaculum arsenaticum]ABP51345.1 conserved hypothetical protein [Pyrobaculum arsenaticum DSM 13514]MCY0889426.1 hypothetical protein [Pyrobaculum arsenaticum]NYR16285.1 hypothetical protein [Pyrobaculum arsenaticum]
MGKRRKRRKVLLRPKRTLPKIFTCPHCGAQLVSVKKTKNGYLVVCGNCGLSYEFEERQGWMHVDYYNAFVDLYLEGKISPPAQTPESQPEESESGMDDESL